MENQPKQQGGNKHSEGNGRDCHNQDQWLKNYEMKDPDAVPTLKFGLSNNFMKFKEALSKKALGEYVALGKLIKKGAIEEPEEPNWLDFDIQDEFDRVAYLEEIKQYWKENTRASTRCSP